MQRVNINNRDQENKRKRHRKEARGFLLSIIGLFLLYALIRPRHSGSLGIFLVRFLFNIAGTWGAFFFAGSILFLGIQLFRNRPLNHPYLKISLSLIIWLIICGLGSLLGKVFWNINYGGHLGEFFDYLLRKLFGKVGSFFILSGGLGVVLLQFTNISLSQIFSSLRERLKNDWEEWKYLRSQRTTNTAPVKIKTAPPRDIPAEISLKRQKEESPIDKTDTSARDQAGGDLPIKEVKMGLDKDREKKKNKEKKNLPDVALVSASGEIKPPDEQKAAEYVLPPLELLRTEVSEEEKSSEEKKILISNAARLEEVLNSFNVQAKVVEINPGPVVTRYDLKPAVGVKIQSIVSLSNDIALALKAPSVRMVAPIPGKDAVGIELPNQQGEIVRVGELIRQPQFQKSESLLTIALGKTSEGEAYFADLEEMPHLLISGATGSGKSVCLHTILISMLYRVHPDEVKFILIDPKRLELTAYEKIPHLYDPKTIPEKVRVITQPTDASSSLNALLRIMEQRYERFAQANVRNIEGYNARCRERGESPEFYIVLIIDELADLMLIAPREIEDAIQRLAQMARAVGIHLVLATQRPSVDVITGVIKANLPVRIAFQVLSRIDSRVILDTQGAEDLLGRGDMLFLPSGAPKPIRLQGAYVSEDEVVRVVDFVCKQGPPDYSQFIAKEQRRSGIDQANLEEELIEALRLIQERRRVSQDLLKAYFRSSAKASNLLSILEIRGFIHKPEGSNRWEIDYSRIEEHLEEAKIKEID